MTLHLKFVRHVVELNLIFCVQIDKRIRVSFEQVCKDIKDRKSYDYVGAYELMKHDKLKRQCFQKQSMHSVGSMTASQQLKFYSIENPTSWQTMDSFIFLTNDQLSMS